MRIVCAENHEQFSANRASLGQRPGIFVLTQFPVVNASPVKASRGADVRLQCGSKSEMPADAKPHRTGLSSSYFRMLAEPVETRAATTIEISDRSFCSVLEPARAPSIVKGNDRARWLDAVINLRRGGNKTVTCKAHTGAQHRPAELKNVRVAPNPGETARPPGGSDERAHRICVGGNVHVQSFDDHAAYCFTNGLTLGNSLRLPQRPHLPQARLRMTSFVAMMEIETLSEWTYMNFGEEARKDAADYPSGMGGRTILLSLALFLGTILLYAPGIRNGFVSQDDPDYVTRNAHVQQGLSLNNVKWAFGTDNPGSNWHPLTWISHMLDVDWYDGRPYGHHLTSILLQAIDVSLLFLLLACAT